MAAGLTASLARWLGGRSALPVSEARAFAPLVPGEVLIGPGGSHLCVERAPRGARVRLQAAPPPVLAPSVDALLESSARVFGSGGQDNQTEQIPTESKRAMRRRTAAILERETAQRRGDFQAFRRLRANARGRSAVRRKSATAPGAADTP